MTQSLNCAPGCPSNVPTVMATMPCFVCEAPDAEVQGAPIPEDEGEGE